MAGFIKKQSFSFYLTILAAVFIIIAFSMYIANTKAGSFFEDMQASIMTMSVISLILCAVLLIAPQVMGNSKLLDIVRLATAVLLAVILTKALSVRVEQMGYTWFSDLDTGDAPRNALGQFLTSWIFYVIALVVTIAASFFQYVKKDAA